jgi:phospholipid/cholesterol/gamma-HCH transport system ATP-binding protein
MGKRGKTPEIKVTDLAIGYDDRVLMENLNFEVYPGEIFFIMGGSGCGKSTLLKHLIGLYEPKRGDIVIRGRSIVNATEELRMEIMRSFGVTYQGGALFGSLTVAENVAMPLEEYTDLSASEIAAVVESKLALVGLAGFGDLMPAELSGGMCKRAGLARALALDPKLLFFDEPSAGLDPVSSAELDRLILDLRGHLGATVVVISHELDSVMSIADRIIMLDKQARGIIAEGDPRELRDAATEAAVRRFLTRDGMKA